MPNYRSEKYRSHRQRIFSRISSVAKRYYQSLSFCHPLQYIAGELIEANIQYVMENSGEEETIGTLERMEIGFSTNQKKWLEELKELLMRQPVRRELEPIDLLDPPDELTERHKDLLISFIVGHSKEIEDYGSDREFREILAILGK